MSWWILRQTAKRRIFFREANPIILITWRLMPAAMRPHGNRETWESEIYFTDNILTGRESSFSSDIGSRQAPPNRPLQLRHQIYFTYNILTGRKSPFSSDIGSREALQFVCGRLGRQIYFTYNILTGRRILRLSNGTVVGLTDDNPPSSRRDLTAKMFRTRKSQP